MNKVALFGGITLGLVAGLGWSVYGKHQSATAHSPTAQASLFSTLRVSNADSANAVAGSAVEIAQIRAVVREELAVAVATLKSSAPSADGKASADGKVVAAAVEPPPTAELLAERREAVQTIESMIANGDWGNDERITFHQKLAVLDPEQAARVLHEVVVGLNTGTIQAHTDGPAI